jgi:hypothetical protein
MMTPEERYRSDSHFHVLVDSLESLIAHAKMSPTEVREAAMLACIHYEMRNPLPTPIVRGVEEALETLAQFRKGRS